MLDSRFHLSAKLQRFYVFLKPSSHSIIHKLPAQALPISALPAVLLSRRRLSLFPNISRDGLEDIFVIVRTGSNEVEQKLGYTLNTTLRGVPRYGIWSDLEESYAGHHIENALDEIDPDLVKNHPDFEYYRRLQEHGKDGFSEEELIRWSQAPNSPIGRDTPAWKLDKVDKTNIWKFLPVAKKAYLRSPSSPWYLFLECDTYVFWDSLLAFLSHFDSNHPFYIGRQLHSGATIFAYGGAGILISNPAMKMLVEHYTSNLQAYNELTIEKWYGDLILAMAMFDAGVDLTDAWPSLEGDMPATLDVASKGAGHRLWCYYATTYHHMTPKDIVQYQEFEISWRLTNSDFPRTGDVFRHLVHPHMSPEISDWDNFSTQMASENATFEECHQICEEASDCKQFSLSDTTCKTSEVVKLGKNQTSEQSSAQPVRSGWIMRRVEALMGATDASCSGQQWKLP
ncbi:glycosyltransferase family 31 protein [Xylariaceae sp. FL1019]|nr:glycosyltransferase family 31 protein [Xylariaceae sp. FL1019]